MRTILILTQKIENQSIQMLIEALQQNQNIQEKYKILVWEINNNQSARIADNKLIRFRREQSIATFNDSILLSELSLVIKRTWGPIRKDVLRICKHLESKNILVLNGCDFIEWSNSKISQYEYLKNTGTIPKSITFQKSSLMLNHDNNENEIISAAKALGYPLVFKTSEGCRADGIYLIESEFSLKELIRTKQNVPEVKNGFILQKFVQTHVDKYISNYYRINVIDGEAQSAVQFQLHWKSVANYSYKSLVDLSQTEDKPVTLKLFDPKVLQIILNAVPLGVVGIDVVFSGKLMYLLEYNDGPNISLTVNLGKKYQDVYKNELDKEAAMQCSLFAIQIGNFCANKLIMVPLEALLPSKL